MPAPAYRLTIQQLTKQQHTKCGLTITPRSVALMALNADCSIRWSSAIGRVLSTQDVKVHTIPTWRERTHSLETRLLDSTKPIPVNRKTPSQNESLGNSNSAQQHKNVNGNPPTIYSRRVPHKLVEVCSSSKPPFTSVFQSKDHPKMSTPLALLPPARRSAPP